MLKWKDSYTGYHVYGDKMLMQVIKALDEALVG